MLNLHTDKLAPTFSYNVRDRVTDELKQQLVNLQQYTKRYSTVNRCGIQYCIDNAEWDAAWHIKKKEVEAIQECLWTT